MTPKLPKRIALTGSSGTGKTTLATFISETYGIPLNPVGSRSVSKAMGFETPYDVDKAGMRAEFQRRLITEKMEWEAAHDEFVTDRSTLDNLIYTMIHDIAAIDEDLYKATHKGMDRYLQIIYCPVAAFCNPGSDPNRKSDMMYHRLYDEVLRGMLFPRDSFGPRNHACSRHTCNEEGIEARKTWVLDLLGSP